MLFLLNVKYSISSVLLNVFISLVYPFHKHNLLFYAILYFLFIIINMYICIV